MSGQVTPEFLVERFGIRPSRAGRIAAYAQLREGGERPSEARRIMRLADDTAGSYERFMQAARGELGLPLLDRPQPTRLKTGAEVVPYRWAGAHSRYHQGRVNPDCPLCVGESP